MTKMETLKKTLTYILQLFLLYSIEKHSPSTQLSTQKLSKYYSKKVHSTYNFPLTLSSPDQKSSEVKTV